MVKQRKTMTLRGLGTGPVRESKPVPVVKRKVAGDREQEARRMREVQARRPAAPSSTNN